MALGGPLEGTRLRLIPAAIIPWEAWLEGHPNTLVLEDERDSWEKGHQRREEATEVTRT